MCLNMHSKTCEVIGHVISYVVVIVLPNYTYRQSQNAMR